MDELEEVLANHLLVEMRLLHYIVNHIFFPKMGRFDFISKRDIMVMFHVVRGIPLNLNLPALMMMQI